MRVVENLNLYHGVQQYNAKQRAHEQLGIKPKIRCAIYTRKSSEEGLEQEFNSLAAQRLAAESYISSQVHEGWVLVPTSYDDGGISGGSLKRSAVQRLFQDIRENKIDNVVVYKGDRLFRSLCDFVDTMRLFDDHKVGFISVTENFNTKTPSGRMHLNMIMSFAQYERELTAERIRDKIGASKRKGMWTGGAIPLGYNANEGKLTVNEREAETIKALFNTFVETESVTETARELNKLGLTTKTWISKTGNIRKAHRFNKKNVRRILENQLYVGKINHKDKIYDGLHAPIITDETWQKVLAIFNKNESEKIISPLSRITVAPLLRGIMNCGVCGSKMTPTYTIRHGLRYRYYICASKFKGKNEECAVGRIPAQETEQLVTSQILRVLKQPEFIVSAIRKSADQFSENIIINSFKQISKIWDELFPIEQIRIIHLLIKNIEVQPNGLNVRIFKGGLSSLLSELAVSSDESNSTIKTNDSDTISIFIPMVIKRRGGAAVVILPKNVRAEDAAKHFDEMLIKTLAKAHKWKMMLEEGKILSISEIATKEKLTGSYITRIYGLNYVAPQIIERIINGTQPRDLKVKDMIIGKIPDLWQGQKEMWGF